MPRKTSPLTERSREDLKKDEREIGANIPEEMIGEDDGDIGEIQRHGEERDGEREKTLEERTPPDTLR